MKNKTKLLFSILLIAVLCCACGKMTKLTEEEQDIITTYIGRQVANHFEDSKSRLLVDNEGLVDEELDIEAPKTDNEKDEVVVPDVLDEPEEQKTPEEMGELYEVTEVVGIENITVDYKDIKIVDEYGYSGIVVYPGDEKKLMVVSFTLNSNSDDEMMIDIFNKALSSKIYVGDSEGVDKLLTMLPNDMTMYAGEISKGTPLELILLYAVEEEALNNTGTVNVEIASIDKKCIINLQ